MAVIKIALPTLLAAMSLSFGAAAQSQNPRGDTAATAPAAASGSSKAAGGVSRDLEKEFKALDRNGDGYLSREEVEQNSALKSGFQDADKNRDGKLDLSEFQAMEANSSPDRSLGSTPPQAERPSPASGSTSSR